MRASVVQVSWIKRRCDCKTSWAPSRAREVREASGRDGWKCNTSQRAVTASENAPAGLPQKRTSRLTMTFSVISVIAHGGRSPTWLAHFTSAHWTLSWGPLTDPLLQGDGLLSRPRHPQSPEDRGPLLGERGDLGAPHEESDTDFNRSCTPIKMPSGWVCGLPSISLPTRTPF